MTVTVGIGTEKGAFILRSDDRAEWRLEGPVLKGWRVTAFGDAPDGHHLAATGSSWYGAAVHRSPDLASWDQVVDGPSFADGNDRSLSEIWMLPRVGDRLYAGTVDAGLFTSDDSGSTWHPVPGLNDHPTRPGWQPGFGGLAAHSLIVDATDPDRMWCGISAVGVLRTTDGGATWVPANEGVPVAAADEEYPGIGYCVHALAADPARPGLLWRQDHRGVFRTTDGGDRWERIEDGLPAGFGFPMVRAGGSLFVVPLESDEYRMPVGGDLAVYRSDDDGDHWVRAGAGYPPGPSYTGVLRAAMSADAHDPAGLYVGTTSGSTLVSPDGGETWRRLPWTLPRILAVHVFAT
jgi:hypothetical protein